ncbi:dysbindin domain-containing protein 1 isoform 1-T1 [Morphnus guianensis]
MAGPGGMWCRLRPAPAPALGGLGAQARWCHDHELCHDHGRLGPAGFCRETNRPLSGLRHRPCFCLTDTKGLCGAGGTGLPAAGTGARGPGQLCPFPRPPPGVPLLPSPSAGTPRGGWRVTGTELPSPTRQVLVSQSSARRCWPRSARRGPPPTGRPRRPPEPPRRSRAASPSPAPACCRSLSADVHFDLLDLTELTDMSDQELAEVFADSDEENAAGESPSGLQPQAVPRAGYLRSPSWTRAREQGREKKHLSDPELPPGPPDAFLPAERPREP